MKKTTRQRLGAIILCVLGVLFSLTLVGMVIGIPMILFGLGLYAKSCEDESGEKPWWARSLIPGFR